jgi:hypothetical protein
MKVKEIKQPHANINAQRRFVDREVSERAQDAAWALDGPEGQELEEAEAIGKRQLPRKIRS